MLRKLLYSTIRRYGTVALHEQTPPTRLIKQCLARGATEMPNVNVKVVTPLVLER